MKKYLYVDTENTGLSFIDLVSRMGKSWSVRIFYSDQSPKLSFAELDLLTNADCRCKLIACRNGRPNAMDFCIMTQLGMAVERHPKAMHLILSRDKGYLAGVELLREKGYYVGEIALDDLTRSISWVSDGVETKPYERIRSFFDSLFALEQIPAEGLGGAAGGNGTTGGSGLSLLPGAENGSGRIGRNRSRRGRSAFGPLTLQGLERILVRIMIEHFDAVGVDRRKKQMGQILRKGLRAAFQNGELHFEQMEPQLRKFAIFRDGDEKVLELLSALSEIRGLLVTGTEHLYENRAETGQGLPREGAFGDNAEEEPPVSEGAETEFPDFMESVEEDLTDPEEEEDPEDPDPEIWEVSEDPDSEDAEVPEDSVDEDDDLPFH